MVESTRAPFRGGSPSRPDAPTIVGREPELAALGGFVGAPWPRALLLDGPAGIGKTTLVEAAGRRAVDAGAILLVARPTLVERDIAHAALSSLLPDERVDPLLGSLAAPRRHALEVALRRRPPDAGELDRGALGLGLLDVLRGLTLPGPLLLVVDDLQWCDTPSAAALAFALRRAGDAPIALLGGVRTAIASEAVDVIVGALRGERLERLLVGPLSLGALGRLIEMRTGRARGRAAVARIAEAAAGNPLLALEIARAIDASGRDPSPSEPLTIPASAEPLIAERLGRLGPMADDTVLAVALAGRATAAEVRRLGTIDGGEAGVDDGNSFDDLGAGDLGLDEAVRAGLLEIDGPDVRLAHPLVGAAAISRATPERRRATHRRLAAVLSDAERALRHRGLAADAPDGRLAVDLDAAATTAAARGAPAIAADLAQLAVDRTPAGDPAVAERWRRVAEHRLAAGELDRAGEAVAAGLALVPPGPGRVPFLLVEVERLHAAEGRAAARIAGSAALAEAGNDAILRAEALAALLGFGVEDAREEARLAHEVLGLLAGHEALAPGAASNALAVLASARLAAGDGPAVDLFERALALDRGRPDFVIGSLEVYGGHLRTADRLAASRAVFAEVLERLAATGSESRRVNALAHAGWTEVLAGDHRAAESLLDAALGLAAELDTDATGARIYAAHLAVLLGDRATARPAAETGLAEAAAAGETWVAALWHRVLGVDDLLEGSLGDAAGHLAATLATALDLGYREPAWARVDADLVEALVAGGRLDAADRAIADFADRAAGAKLPWSTVTLARSEALLRAARGDLDGALGAIERAADAAAGLEHALERGRFDLVRGGILRRVRRVREARAALEAARSTFAAAPSPPWESRAVAELARLGGRPGAGDTLTPAERQVAEMAAAGRSNREIADALVVSVRTVESQLSAAYAKLGVRGRTALARALREDARPGE